MADRKVAITGLGVVTPIGVGLDAMWESLVAGGAKAAGVSEIRQFDASGFECTAAGQLGDDFSARNYVPKDYRKAVKVMARDIEIAVAAADLAFRDSGLVTKAGGDVNNMTVHAKRLGCNIGAGLICQDLNELGSAAVTAVVDGKFDLKAWGKVGMNNLTPLWLLKYLPNMLSCHVTIIHGCEGPSNCITCGDASGLLAIGEGGRYITRNIADAVVAGGAESKLNPVGLLRQSMLKRLVAVKGRAHAEVCRPFDAEHGGTVIGEGGGVVVMEEMEHARKRGAKIYAELAGVSGACDPAAIDILRPTAGSVGMAVAKAMAQAGVTPDQVDLIVAHGTGVAGEDDAESAEWSKAMGGRIKDIPAVAIAGSVGSLFAGAGGVELAVAAKAMQTGIVPATTNFKSPSAACKLNLSSSNRNADIRCAVVGAFTVGGQSCACVLKRA